MSTYTREDWHKHGTFKAVPGQEVAPEIYGEMLDCMPPLGLPAVPATRDYDRGFLVGEPTDFDPVTHRSAIWHLPSVADGATTSDYCPPLTPIDTTPRPPGQRRAERRENMKRDKLIAYYTQRLEKVKATWNVEAAADEYQAERCREYVAAALADLEAVKNGREW